MDIISHVLTANLGAKYLSKKDSRIPFITVIIAGTIPDIGEILIQTHLSNKFGTDFGVYDQRTSDVNIASTISTTWLYDLLHSPILFLFCFLLAYISPNQYRYILKAIGYGLLFHILLDCCTHGTVWALKLLFPISNQRFPIFSDTIGNWWDWTPKINLPLVSYGFPIYNIIYIFIIISLTIILNKKYQSSN